MKPKRVLCINDCYPQLSETYIETEAWALYHNGYDLKFLSRQNPDLPSKNHFPVTVVRSLQQLKSEVESFAPDIIHGHRLFEADILCKAAQIADRKFTVRSHSYDVVGANAQVSKFITHLNSPFCLGVLCFPFAVDILSKAGVNPDRIYPCWPVVDRLRFLDKTQNGNGVMNVGACIPKKSMEDFIALALAAPGPPYRLYAIGYGSEDIERANHNAGGPVEMVPPVELVEMPAEYKRHRWLVYTGSVSIASIGWPMAVAEAQASGVGVCMRNLRPDLKEYVGPGFLFDTIEDVVKIIRKPFSEDLRQQGFEHSRKSDIRSHIKILEDLWANG